MAAAKKPAAPKPATKTVAKAVPVAKPVAPPAAKAAPAVKAAPAKRTLDQETRSRMIAEAAYYIAEKRGFIHGHHDADWAEAEAQIDRLLGL